MQCPQCHTTASPGARFCRHCGRALGDLAAAQAPTSPPAGRTSSPDAPAVEHDDTQVVTAADEATPAEATACTACGAPNSPRRELCGQCGADLATGIVPPVAVDDPAPRPEPRGRTRGRGPRLAALAAGVLGLVAVIILGLSLAGLGPLAAGPSLPSADFDPDAYPRQSAPLPLAEIATSTTLTSNGGGDADASQMADDDPATAWRSDGSRFEDGVGETIDLYLAEPAWIERVVVNNGFHRDADAYADHARIRLAELILDGGERLSIRLEDLGLQRQAIELPEPRLTATVRLEVTETFPGDAVPDLAVSDVELEGWQAHEQDAEVARERAARAGAAGAVR